MTTFYANRKHWWEGQVDRAFEDSSTYREGATAFAHRQISVCRSLEKHCSWLGAVMGCWFTSGSTGGDSESPWAQAAAGETSYESLGGAVVFF